MSLRLALRDELRPAHDRLDAALGALDLSERAGLLSFLQCQWAVWGHIPDTGATRDLLIPVRAALRADLATLGWPAQGAPRVTAHDDRAPEDRAVEYMLLGSRAGAMVLRKRWQTTQDRRVGNAGQFLNLPPERPRWRALCDQLHRCDSHSPAGRRTLHDAGMIYAAFANALAETGHSIE